jgi:regulator of ribonuclease activity A
MMNTNTADIYDAHHETLQVCNLQFRSFGKRAFFYGQAETLKTFEDHTPVLKAVSEPGNRRVLVVDAGGSLRVGVMGDRLAEIAAANDWAGVVINGAIRDSVGIDRLDIGVKALGVTARRGWQPTPGERGVPLTFGDIAAKSGDWIYADADAVLVSPGPLDLSVVAGATPIE